MKIALVGYSGSGKTTVANYVNKKYKYDIASTGKICRSISLLLFGNENRGNMNKLSDALFQISPNILLQAALIGIGAKCVFDSIRYKRDFNELKRQEFVILWIKCNREEATRRLVARKQVFNKEDLKHSSENNVDIIEYDYVIENEGTLENLYYKIDCLLSEIEKR